MKRSRAPLPTGPRAPSRRRVARAQRGRRALGDVIADAQLAATRDADKGGAVVAFTNPGGIRTDVIRKEDGAVSFADVFASQPFRNQLVTLTLRRSGNSWSSNGWIRSGRASCRSPAASATRGTPTSLTANA